MTVSDLLEQPCNKSENINKLLQLLTACSKLVDNLGQAVRTQLVDGLLADLLQDVSACVLYEFVVYFKKSTLMTRFVGFYIQYGMFLNFNLIF
jgi:hypothetical protein